MSASPLAVSHRIVVYQLVSLGLAFIAYDRTALIERRPRRQVDRVPRYGHADVCAVALMRRQIAAGFEESFAHLCGDVLGLRVHQLLEAPRGFQTADRDVFRSLSSDKRLYLAVLQCPAEIRLAHLGA